MILTVRNNKIKEMGKMSKRKEIELIDRKRTTKQGLIQLEELIDSFNDRLSEDIDTINSKDFFMKIRTDNGLGNSDIDYKYWENIVGFWKIRSGQLMLVSEDKEQIADLNQENIDPLEIKQINFQDCLESLMLVMDVYNEKCKKKDAQIKNFIGFCKRTIKRHLNKGKLK